MLWKATGSEDLIRDKAHIGKFPELGIEWQETFFFLTIKTDSRKIKIFMNHRFSNKNTYV